MRYGCTRRRSSRLRSRRGRRRGRRLGRRRRSWCLRWRRRRHLRRMNCMRSRHSCVRHFRQCTIRRVYGSVRMQRERCGGPRAIQHLVAVLHIRNQVPNDANLQNVICRVWSLVPNDNSALQYKHVAVVAEHGKRHVVVALTRIRIAQAPKCLQCSCTLK